MKAMSWDVAAANKLMWDLPHERVDTMIGPFLVACIDVAKGLSHLSRVPMYLEPLERPVFHRQSMHQQHYRQATFVEILQSRTVDVMRKVTMCCLITDLPTADFIRDLVQNPWRAKYTFGGLADQPLRYRPSDFGTGDLKPGEDVAHPDQVTRIVLPDRWLSYRNDNVLQLAKALSAQVIGLDLRILGDALEEAGCTEERILDHCRNPRHRHIKGCWLLEIIQGRRD